MDLFPMHSWHPMVIHFPLVAFLAAVGLDLLAGWSGSPRWRPTATFLWWTGLLGAVAAIVTGLLAFSRVEHSDLAHVQMTLHRNVAFLAVGLLAVTAIWRWRRPASRGAAFLGVLGVSGLLWVGYLGGELVFRHAVGIPTESIEQVMMERGGHGHEAGQHMLAPGDSAVTTDAQSKAHRHAEGDSTPMRAP